MYLRLNDSENGSGPKCKNFLYSKNNHENGYNCFWHEKNDDDCPRDTMLSSPFDWYKVFPTIGQPIRELTGDRNPVRRQLSEVLKLQEFDDSV